MLPCYFGLQKQSATRQECLLFFLWDVWIVDFCIWCAKKNTATICRLVFAKIATGVTAIYFIYFIPVQNVPFLGVLVFQSVGTFLGIVYGKVEHFEVSAFKFY